MKFGKTLTRTLISEWSRNYMAYKNLKRALAAIEQQPEQEDLLTAFFFDLDRELEKVNSFFVYKKSEMERRIRIFVDKYRILQANIDHEADTSAAAGLMSSLTETKEQLHKLLDYVKLNSEGFRKILKKFDKRTGKNAADVYWRTEVAVAPFVLDGVLDELLERIDDILKQLRTIVDEISAPSTSPTRALAARAVPQVEEYLVADDLERVTAIIYPLVQSISTESSNRALSQILAKACRLRAYKCIKSLVLLGVDLSGRGDIMHRLVLGDSAKITDRPYSDAAITNALHQTTLSETSPIQRSDSQETAQANFIDDLLVSSEAFCT